MKDNLNTLYEKFELSVGKQYAGGSAYTCRKCGRVAFSVELWFPCQEAFVPTKVICQECGTKWTFALVDDAEKLEKRMGAC
jgi:ribosomal protein L37E